MCTIKFFCKNYLKKTHVSNLENFQGKIVSLFFMEKEKKWKVLIMLHRQLISHIKINFPTKNKKKLTKQLCISIYIIKLNICERVCMFVCKILCQ